MERRQPAVAVDRQRAAARCRAWMVSGRLPGGIVVLGDGSLLLTGELSHWEMLRPGAGAWCRVRSVATGLQRAEQASPVVEIAGQLWWLVYHGSGPAGGPAGLAQSQTPDNRAGRRSPRHRRRVELRSVAGAGQPSGPERS